jgi:hypothetical protein
MERVGPAARKERKTSVHGRRFAAQEIVAAFHQQIDRLLDIALNDSFPASDPISTMRLSGP